MARLILHVCCAPDATTALDRLAKDWDITTLFYNPNLFPNTEYDLREAETRYVSMIWGVPYVEGERDPKPWLEAVKGHTDEPEGGERCRRCIRQRLEWSAEYTRDHGGDAFATTLTVSPHKDVKFIHEVGRELAEKYGVEYLPETLRKANGFLQSLEWSKRYGLYRQNYCGCRWSMPGVREKFARRESQTNL